MVEEAILRGNQRYFTIGYRTPVRDEFEEEHIQFPVIHRGFGLPMTKYPMDSMYMPRFVFDLEEAFNRLGRYDSLEVLDHGRQEIQKLMDKWQSKKDRKEGRAMGEDPTANQRVTDMVNKVVKERKISKTNAFVIVAGDIGKSRHYVRDHYLQSNSEDDDERVRNLVNDIRKKKHITKTQAFKFVAKELNHSESWVRNHYIP